MVLIGIFGVLFALLSVVALPFAVVAAATRGWWA